MDEDGDGGRELVFVGRDGMCVIEISVARSACQTSQLLRMTENVMTYGCYLMLDIPANDKPMTEGWLNTLAFHRRQTRICPRS